MQEEADNFVRPLWFGQGCCSILPLPLFGEEYMAAHPLRVGERYVRGMTGNPVILKQVNRDITSVSTGLKHIEICPMSTREKLEPLVRKYFAPLICGPHESPSAKKAPGGICGILYQGELHYFSLGRIDNNGTPPTKETVFGLGSVTKVLTTSILGQYSELFGLSINNYLPDGYQLQPAEQPATFTQLATFTAGIVPSNPPRSFGPANQANFIRFINQVSPPNNKLPADNVYSNSSIGFLAQILMSLDQYTTFTGKDTTQWMKKHLLDNLGMLHTGAPPFTDGAHVLSDAFNYSGSSGNYEIVDYHAWKPWGAAGRMYSTCSDMMNFVQANCGISNIGGKTVDPTILEGMKQAQQPWADMPREINKQGFAWVISQSDTGDPVCYKNGGLPGVSSFITCCPDQQTGLVILTNMFRIGPSKRGSALLKALIQLQAGL